MWADGAAFAPRIFPPPPTQSQLNLYFTPTLILCLLWLMVVVGLEEETRLLGPTAH